MTKAHQYVSKTKRALFVSSFLHEPFASLYPLLPFILLMNLGASSFQIVLLTMLKPVASIFSFYWSEKVSQNKHSLRMSLVGAGLLGRLPFLLAIFTDNVWFLIAASTIYMLFTRAGIPAWMEILNRNLPARGIRERCFSLGSALGYGEGVLLAIGLGSLLDEHIEVWRVLFGVGLLLGMLGTIWQGMLPIRFANPSTEMASVQRFSWKGFIQPWLDCIKLMRTRGDFRRFQWAFMTGGLGLMIVQPVIPLFFADVLHLSYRDLLIAYSICKGLGFVCTSRIWGRAMNRISVGSFTAFVLIGFALFPVFILLAQKGIVWLYVAYIVYGIAQAGSHLIWHLSGPLFAGSDQSLRYSGVNIVMVGVRGMLGPPLGGLLAFIFGPIVVLILSAFFCIGGTLSMVLKTPERLKLPA